jgi:SAM-dependent methyltransferase
LTDDGRAELDRRARAGTFVSEDFELPKRNYLSGLQSDRLSNAGHIETLGSLLDLRGARVLEIRSRTGAILDALRRLHGIEPYALAIFESQQHIVRSVYGIRTDALIDFDTFSIPYEGLFDVIISNHMIAHVLRPREFLRTIHRHLKPGGRLYLYNEPDDAEYLDLTQSMFNVLNPFHLQAFDRKALVRALGLNGFRTTFVGHAAKTFFLLSTRIDEASAEPLEETEWRARVSKYSRARDHAILRLEPHQRERFSGEWEDVFARAIITGVAEVDSRGRIRVRRTLDGSADVAYHA